MLYNNVKRSSNSTTSDKKPSYSPTTARVSSGGTFGESTLIIPRKYSNRSSPPTSDQLCSLTSMPSAAWMHSINQSYRNQPYPRTLPGDKVPGRHITLYARPRNSLRRYRRTFATSWPMSGPKWSRKYALIMGLLSPFYHKMSSCFSRKA